MHLITQTKINNIINRMAERHRFSDDRQVLTGKQLLELDAVISKHGNNTKYAYVYHKDDKVIMFWGVDDQGRGSLISENIRGISPNQLNDMPYRTIFAHEVQAWRSAFENMQ